LHEVLSSRNVFDGKMIGVFVDEIRLPDGSSSKREIVRHPGAAGIVALVDDRFLLVRQNRHAVGEDLLEIPAGKLDTGEDPEACAQRELLEETGYRCTSLRRLMTFLTSPGFSDERVHLYLTLDAARETDPPEVDDGEPISIEWLDREQVKEAILGGRLVDSKTIIGLLLADLVDLPN
jgi:ADP-ribose pyrophosphatase